MKFISLMSSVCVSLFLLPQAAQADISYDVALDRLKALGAVMSSLGLEETFRTIKSGSAAYSISPGSNDQIGFSNIVTALDSSGGAHLFCVKNNILVASTRPGAKINRNVMGADMNDSNGENPFVKMKDALKMVSSEKKTAKVVVVKVTDVLSDAYDADKKQNLAIQHSVLVANRRSLIGDKAASDNPNEQFYCGIEKVKP